MLRRRVDLPDEAMNAESMAHALVRSNPVRLAAATRQLQPSSNAELVRGLVAGDDRAAVMLFDEYSGLVERTIVRVMGFDQELPDAVQDAFVSALRSVHSIQDPQALPQWMRRVAVHTAVDWVRRRRRKRWLAIVDPQDLADRSVSSNSTAREALEATYQILDKLSVQERTVFALKYLEGLGLQEIADACGLSLATVKRRLNSADRRFRKLARQHGTLSLWLQDDPQEAG